MKKKKSVIQNEISKKEFRVTIFGSARIKKGDERYIQVHALAKFLGEKGIDIVTGGGPGIMAAASLGHKQGRKSSNIHSIGLGIKLPHEQGLNKGVNLGQVYNRFSTRLDNFMLLSNVVVVAPGGIGTVLEFFYTLQLIQVNHICHIPIILLGKQWKGLIKWLEKGPLKHGLLDAKDLNTVFFAKDCNQAIKIIETVQKDFQKGDKNFCLNYKKYK